MFHGPWVKVDEFIVEETNIDKMNHRTDYNIYNQYDDNYDIIQITPSQFNPVITIFGGNGETDGTRIDPCFRALLHLYHSLKMYTKSGITFNLNIFTVIPATLLRRIRSIAGKSDK